MKKYGPEPRAAVKDSPAKAAAPAKTMAKAEAPKPKETTEAEGSDSDESSDEEGVQPVIAPKSGRGDSTDPEAKAEGSGLDMAVVYCGNCGLPPEYCEFGPGGQVF